MADKGQAGSGGSRDHLPINGLADVREFQPVRADGFDVVERLCDPERRPSASGCLSPVDIGKQAMQSRLTVHESTRSSRA